MKPKAMHYIPELQQIARINLRFFEFRETRFTKCIRFQLALVTPYWPSVVIIYVIQVIRG